MQFVFEAIGTKWVLDIIDVPEKVDQSVLLEKIKNRIDSFDKAYSRFRHDSLVTKMSQHAAEYILPDDAPALMQTYHNLYKITDGMFTPLIGQMLVDAGYDAEYSFQAGQLHHPPLWEKVLTYSDSKLKIKKPVLLDFGAAGKGYLIDIIGALLQKEDIHSFCIDAGGDILYRTSTNTPLKVGLEHPEDTIEVIGVAHIINQSICGSAGNRRRWKDFHHILHPHKLAPQNDVLATWVIAKDTMTADALATCLFFVTTDILAKYYDFEYVILYPDYTIKKSSAFPAEIFYNKNI